jgi:PAS domain S-box-containing protein
VAAIDELERRVAELEAALHDERAARADAEQRRREAEALQRKTFHESPVALALTTLASGRFLDVNEGFLRFLGRPRADVVGHTTAEIGLWVDPTERSRITEVLRAGRSVRRAETLANTADGQKSALYDLDPVVVGGVPCILGSVIDISDRKRAERALRESQVRLQGILDHTSAVIYVKDREGRYLLVNRRFQALFHVDEGEVVGRSDFELFPREAAEAFRANDREALLAGAPIEREEIAPQDDGPHTYISLKFPLFDDAGAAVAVCGISTDFTDRKRAAETLALQAAELRRSNADLEQFAWVASHDLQEPLRMVASFTQLLQRRYDDRLDDEAREFIRFAVDGATRMQTLITDLLSLSRVATRGKPFAPVDVSAALERALGNLRVAVEESGATVTAGALPTVTADAGQLVQLLQNLVGNALKFRGAAPPEVQVFAERRDGAWEIAVRDRGIGIAPDDGERIFLVFQRLHGRGEYPGTGIGLAICRRIVERLGGRIWVESRVGEGATFRFTVPDRAAEGSGPQRVR